MSYQVWSVVYGEQPSASKWNILGNNDISFNDGTGIIDDAIIQRHFADSSVDTPHLTSEAQAWKELDRDTLAGAGTNLQCTFTAKKYLMVIVGAVANAAGTNMNFYFNGDTGANYAQRYSSNHGADTAAPSVNGFAGEVGNFLADGAELIILEIYNPSGADKSVDLNTVHQTALDAATAPAWSDLQAIWNNTAQVNQIDCTAVSGGLKAGSEMVVLGHD